LEYDSHSEETQEKKKKLNSYSPDEEDEVIMTPLSGEEEERGPVDIREAFKQYLAAARKCAHDQFSGDYSEVARGIKTEIVSRQMIIDSMVNERKAEAVTTYFTLMESMGLSSDICSWAPHYGLSREVCATELNIQNRAEVCGLRMDYISALDGVLVILRE